jgi:uncharacterized protein
MQTKLVGLSVDEYHKLVAENKEIAVISGLRSHIPDEVRMNFDDQKNPKIEGHAAVFNQRTQLFRGFFEQVSPGAFREAIGSADDIFAVLNHDESLAFASTRSGTLHLSEDQYGLKYEVYPIPEIDTAERVKKLIKLGIIRNSSFRFNIEDERIERLGDGKGLLRTILKVKPLFDVSPVTFPAYQGAEVYVRMNAGNSLGGEEQIITADEVTVIPSPQSDEDLFKQCDELLKGAFRK